MLGIGAALALCIGKGEGKAIAADAKTAFTPDQKAAIEQILHDYLVENPEVVIDALKALDAKEKAARAESAKQTIRSEAQELKHDGANFVAGNPKGDVTLVEFFDYNCGYCKLAASTVQSALADDKNLRVIFKEWPIRGAGSVGAARVSIAAAKQPKFLAFHFTLLAEQGPVDEARALEVAQKTGLDMARLRADMKSVKADDVIQRNDALAAKIGIDGTPAFIIGDTLVPGAVSKARLYSLIAETRKACKTSNC